MSLPDTYEIQGRNVSLPAVVRDASSGTAMYMVDAGAAQHLVPEAFEVVEAAPGQTQVTLIIVDYRDNDLGDYDEVGIVFFVRPAGKPDAELGSYIYKLPVNQSFTCEAGCKIWGFPKSVEDLEFQYTENSASCKLTMSGQHVLTLTVPRGGDGESADSAATGYTLIEGVPHQNEFVRGGTGEQTIPGGEGVVLELGDHPLADELRALGLPTATPLLSAWTEHMRGSFGKSEKA
ncbi:MAG: acetoacetate decarboxylase family protein [bacterium]|nr:acetoacetate decarboxylase [Deltaproteobacteria bacterium]MCP4904804.1 acetoacetate decarboxylase family protein [bacterium]